MGINEIDYTIHPYGRPRSARYYRDRSRWPKPKYLAEQDKVRWGAASFICEQFDSSATPA
jgi:hypothetical protein